MILTVARLKNNYTQEEIGNKIGWSRSKVCDYSSLLKNINSPQIFKLAKEYYISNGEKILHMENSISPKVGLGHLVYMI